MLVIFFFFLLLLSKPAAAFDYEACVTQASVTYHVSPILIESIIKAESGGNPYALSVKLKSEEEAKRFLFFLLNIGIKAKKKGKVVSIFPKSKTTATTVISYFPDFNIETYDVGLMQINKCWIEKYNLNPNWLLNPCYNIKWGSYVLSLNVSQYGFSWKAVWKYNGKKTYLDKILKNIKVLCEKKYKDSQYCLDYYLNNN
ncbi:lytic transglycosylase domain-containing protein [Desulfurobacterium sp.]